MAGRRHCGIGFKLVFDNAVRQLGRELDEQIVDISVRAGLKRLRDLHGSLPGQSSTAQSLDALQGFLTGQGSGSSSRSSPRTGLKVLNALSQDRVLRLVTVVVFQVYAQNTFNSASASASCGPHLTCAGSVSSANSC